MNAVRQVHIQVYRSARIHLGVNGGGHSLLVELGVALAVLDRDRVHRLGDALAAVPDQHALALLAIFAPVGDVEDVQYLRRAVAAFEEEVAFEDRRQEPRSHKASKILRV